ncbi:MAG: terminase large subunit [Defluviitaleaceae bacterium]|nr:terminase large subunit [Defluviitaleaceae bacterium]
MNNPMGEYHRIVESNSERFSADIVRMTKLQKVMFGIYDFLPERADAVISWIERNCILPTGENAGQPVRLLLWQKWVIYSIFGFWGWFDEDVYDEIGNVVDTRKKYLRVVNDILLVVASGNTKTTFMGFLNTYLLFASKSYPAAKAYIGSNAQVQSKLCFDVTKSIILKNRRLEKLARVVPSMNTIEIPKAGSMLMAMSRDGGNFEGIIPTNIIIDELHEMKTSKYADDLRKSVKRDDSFIFEITTMGTVRGGYLDARIEYAEKILSGDMENHRFFCCIYRQDSEEEIIRAYESGDLAVFMKSNPSLGSAVSQTMLKDKVREMLGDPTKRTVTLTKNFNIPQNPETCFFSHLECQAKPFDESIFYGAPVFWGLDMAYTRSPENDLACLSMMTVNPITEEEYFKDFYFLSKWYEHQNKINGEIVIERMDMIKAKSKVDTGIIYDAKSGKYGYQMYAERGDMVIVDEGLAKDLAAQFGLDAPPDCTGITQKFILIYLAYLENLYGCITCKFGLDPNKAGDVSSFVNANLRSIDGLPVGVKFLMERQDLAVPIMESTKDARARGLVYCNNKLTELHFANAQVRPRGDGFVLANPKYSRKDGVIAQMAARSAYNVFVNNKHTGAANKRLLAQWWGDRL